MSWFDQSRRMVVTETGNDLVQKIKCIHYTFYIRINNTILHGISKLIVYYRLFYLVIDLIMLPTEKSFVKLMRRQACHRVWPRRVGRSALFCNCCAIFTTVVSFVNRKCWYASGNTNASGYCVDGHRIQNRIHNYIYGTCCYVYSSLCRTMNGQ